MKDFSVTTETDMDSTKSHILVVGATGATGRLLVQCLLDRGEKVRIIVRAVDVFSDSTLKHPNLEVVQARLLSLTDRALSHHTRDCKAVASCLGHTASFRGIFGPPFRLVTHATKRLCRALQGHPRSCPARFVLMNTTGNRNPDRNESGSTLESVILSLLKVFIPPHADNLAASAYLRTNVGQGHKAIEWVAVRPDGLIDEAARSDITVHPSPTRSPIFDSGQTSRINVACFMADLITDDDLWHQWKGQMSVIYNKHVP